MAEANSTEVPAGTRKAIAGGLHVVHALVGAAEELFRTINHFAAAVDSGNDNTSNQPNIVGLYALAEQGGSRMQEAEAELLKLRDQLDLSGAAATERAPAARSEVSPGAAAPRARTVGLVYTPSGETPGTLANDYFQSLIAAPKMGVLHGVMDDLRRLFGDDRATYDCFMGTLEARLVELVRSRSTSRGITVDIDAFNQVTARCLPEASAILDLLSSADLDVSGLHEHTVLVAASLAQKLINEAEGLFSWKPATGGAK